MIQNIRSRMNKRGFAILLTFGLLITGSGLASLASLQDTMQDTIVFNTLSVDLKDGNADSSAVTFSSIDPSTAADFSQDLDLNNSGTASATVSLDTLVSVGAGSDLDTAIHASANDGTCAAAGPRIDGGTGLWGDIATLGNTFPNIALNAGQHKAICLRWHFDANPSLATTSLTTVYTFVATHP